MAQPRKIDWSSMWKKEDWWALWIGTLLFLLCLPAATGVSIFGWLPKTGVWLDPAKALATTKPKVYPWHGVAALFLEWIVVLIIMTIAARIMGIKARDYAIGLTIIFWLTWACWLCGHYAYIAATPADWPKFGISWGLSLTGEAGYLIALVVGLIIGNVLPRVPKVLEAAARPEWYIKTAIVLLGAVVGAKTATQLGVAAELVTRSFIAIFVAYLIYWPIAYVISRRLFKLDMQWSATLASGVGVCGVSAAIAAAAAIRAPSIIPITIASIIVLFACIELLILPLVAAYTPGLYNYPFAMGAWMGLAVKTDGAAAASGAIVDALISAKPGFEQYKGWILATAVTNKIFIDIWIGLMAFILAVIWVYRIERKPGEKVPVIELWFRFPKFIIGYIFTWLCVFFIGYSVLTATGDAKLTESIGGAITGESDLLRQLYFAMTFMSIGIVTRFRKFREIGAIPAIGAYVVSLVVIIFIALGISLAVFAPMKLPAS